MIKYTWLVTKDILDSDKYPFKKAHFRRLLFNRKENGLDKVVRKFGGKLFFRSDRFDEWVENQSY